MNSARIKASLMVFGTLVVCGLLLSLMVQQDPHQPGEVAKLATKTNQLIRVMAIPAVAHSSDSEPTPADVAKPAAAAQKLKSTSQTTGSASAAGSKKTARLDDRNSAGLASDSRSPGVMAPESRVATIDPWLPQERPEKPSNSVTQRSMARRRLRLPDAGAREPGQSPILFFDWSVPLLHDLVSRNLGCIVVRDSIASEPAGMLLVSGTGWRFAPFAAQISLAGVKLPLNPEDQPAVRELILIAQWAIGRKGSFLEFFPSASLWEAWSTEQHLALNEAKLSMAQIAVTAGYVVWESGTPRYAVDEVAFTDGKRQTIANALWASRAE